MIAHELAHVRRRDYALNLVQVAADVILWFHPAARWLSRRVRIEREVPAATTWPCAWRAIHGTMRVPWPRSKTRGTTARSSSRASSGTLLDRIQRIVGEPRPILTPVRAMPRFALAIAIGSVVATLAQVVPPALPLDVRLRSRTPPPAGARMPASAPLAPRVPQR